MTKVTILQNSKNECVGFDVYGHAGYADAGEDIVCAAISILVINTITMEKRDNLHYGKFKNITIIYTVFVMGTMLLSINGFVASGFKSVKYIVLILAGVLFALSDLVLAKIYFGDKNNGKYVALNHILYYAAQFLFASSILF